MKLQYSLKRLVRERLDWNVVENKVEGSISAAFTQGD